MIKKIATKSSLSNLKVATQLSEERVPLDLLQTETFLLVFVQHLPQKVSHVAARFPECRPALDNLLCRVERVELFHKKVEDLAKAPQVEGAAAVPLVDEVFRRKLLLRTRKLSEIFHLGYYFLFNNVLYCVFLVFIYSMILAYII